MRSLAELEGCAAKLMKSIIPRPEFRAPEAEAVVREAWHAGRGELARDLIPLLLRAGDGDRAALDDAIRAAYAVLPPYLSDDDSETRADAAGQRAEFACDMSVRGPAGTGKIEGAS